MEMFPVPTIESIKSKTLIPGERNSAFLQNDSTFWNYRISVPEILEGQKVPLIIALHWAGEDQTYKEFGSCLVEPALKDLNAIIISPSASSSNWWEARNEARLLQLIAVVKDHWPIDPSKIAITGYSNGGIGSWDYAIRFPELFSAAIPMAGSYNNTDRKIQIPVYAIHGEMDDLFSLATVKDQVDASINSGSNIEWKVATGLSHFMACEYVSYLKEAGNWLETEIWD